MCTVFPTNKQNHLRAIHPNDTVGAVPVCPPERPRSDVSIPNIHVLCAGILTMDAPLWGDTGGHIGTAPTNLHHIFPRNPTQTKSTVPHAIHPNETVGAVLVCPPEHPRSSVSIPKNIRIVCGELNDGCALVGRHGRAHRHRPYQTPLYIYTSGAEMQHALPPPFLK